MGEDDLRLLAHPEYWNERYAKPEEQGGYDWLKRFDDVKPFLLKHLSRAHTDGPRVLHVGCGNSTMTSDLYDLGFNNQISIDFSPVVIDGMKAKHPSLDWRIMDARSMEFNPSSFDVVIDKATLDAMLYGSLWDPSDEVRTNVTAYVNEVARVLRDGGIWLYITWRQPHFIRPLIARESVWSIGVEVLEPPDGIGGVFEYYGYVIRKLDDTSKAESETSRA